jgi:hypothetical protein
MWGLPELERNCVAGQQPMEERLPHLLVGILIVSGCVVECEKQFVAALLMSASIRQLVNESAYCVIVSNGELVQMTSHDRTSLVWKLFGNYTVQGQSSWEK